MQRRTNFGFRSPGIAAFLHFSDYRIQIIAPLRLALKNAFNFSLTADTIYGMLLAGMTSGHPIENQSGAGARSNSRPLAFIRGSSCTNLHLLAVSCTNLHKNFSRGFSANQNRTKPDEKDPLPLNGPLIINDLRNLSGRGRPVLLSEI